MLDINPLYSDVAHLSEDVLRERQRAHTTSPSDAHPIIVRDLRKTFPRVHGNPEKVAVSNLSLTVSSGECVGCVCVITWCFGFHAASVMPATGECC
jgi:ABC-type glutathione transport system ATPase component